MTRNLTAPRLTNSRCLPPKAPVFPADQYQRLIGGGAPFPRTQRHGRRRKPPGTEAETTGSRSTFPDDWNGVLVVAYHPTFHEMRRMEQHPGEFIGVMTGEAYTLLTSHILQKIGLHWEKCLKANLVPWYIPPKGRRQPPGKNGMASNSSNG